MAAAPRYCIHRMKLIFLMEDAGESVLTFVLKRGAKKAPTTPPGEYLTDYLENLGPDSTANYGRETKQQNVNNKMKREHRKLLKRYEDQIQCCPLWEKFDISLLFIAIQLTCESVAVPGDDKWKDQNTLEGMITRIKDERNELIHGKKSISEKEYQHKINELEKLYEGILNAAKTKYCIPDPEVTFAMNSVRQVTDSFRKTGMEKGILFDHFKARHQEFVRDCKSHLKKDYDVFQIIDPFFFLTKLPKQEFNIQEIFFKLSLKKRRKHVQKSQDIDAYDVLTVTRRTLQTTQPSTSSSAPRSAEPQLVLIEGVAGSGKTTLLTFLLSEWLLNHKRVKHLHDYDIVLRVLCRENRGPSLQNFLKQVLPDHFAVMDEHLVNRLKRCKVLFLIDGIDELSPGSQADQLVADILNISENSSNFTLVCTSRPEATEDFQTNKPASIEVCNMVMKGVSEEQRTPFILEYYRRFPVTGNKNPEKLKLHMEQVGWRKHYGLPLNLLFVAKIMHEYPERITSTTTQTSLYVIIRDWCIEKLQARLPKLRDRRTREADIREVLQDMYEVALQALRQDRVTLSDEEEQRVRNACNKKGLPSQELLPAFFNLLDIKDKQGRHQQQLYTMPHKSLQEFYAASRIVHRLEDGSDSSDIRRMLGNPPPEQLRSLRNLLRHVAGLLCYHETSGCAPPRCAPAIKEVVDLLAETGMRSCDDWLSVLDDTEMNQTALDCVARHITSDEREQVRITDSTITSATALLPRITSKIVRIELSRKESDVQGLISEHHRYIMVILRHHYRHPDQATVSDSSLRATTRINLEVFEGHLSGAGTQLLHQCRALQYLYLAVCDQDAQEILAAIRTVIPSLPQLEELYLHVPVGAVRTEVCSTPLPRPRARGKVVLVLSGVDETLLDQASQIARQLQPTDETYTHRLQSAMRHPYRSIRCPDSNMTADVWRRLLQELAAAGVTVQGFGIRAPDTSPITQQEERELFSLAETTMLGDFRRVPQERMWR